MEFFGSAARASSLNSAPGIYLFIVCFATVEENTDSKQKTSGNDHGQALFYVDVDFV